MTGLNPLYSKPSRFHCDRGG